MGQRAIFLSNVQSLMTQKRIEMKSNKIHLYILSWYFIRNTQNIFSSSNYRTKK